MSFTSDNEARNRSYSNEEQDDTSQVESNDDDLLLSDYIKVEDRVEHVLFRITDYLAEQGRRDLFSKLTTRDVALFIYQPSYVNYLRKNVANTIL
jgi:hypothetical protein